MEELYHDFYEADMDKIRKIIEKHLTPKKPEQVDIDKIMKSIKGL